MKCTTFGRHEGPSPGEMGYGGLSCGKYLVAGQQFSECIALRKGLWSWTPLEKGAHRKVISKHGEAMSYGSKTRKRKRKAVKFPDRWYGYTCSSEPEKLMGKCISTMRPAPIGRVVRDSNSASAGPSRTYARFTRSN